MEDTSQNAGGTGAPAGGGSEGTGAAAPAAPSKPTSASSALTSAAARSAASPASAQPAAKPNGAAGAAGQPAGQAPRQPTAAPATGAAPAPKGPIPFDEHDKAIKNARTKAAEEAIANFAWAKGLDPEDVKAALARWNRLKSDPRKFSSELIAELEGLDDALPDADIVAKDGSKVYSVGTVQKIVQQIRNEMRRTAQQAVQPFVDERQQAQEQREQAERLEQAKQEGRRVIREAVTHARTLPHFTENEAKISEKLDTIPAEVRMQVGLVAALYMAYSAVLAELNTSARNEGEEATLIDLKKKAIAGTGNAAPGGPNAQGKPAKPANVGQLARHMERLSEQMARAQ